MLVSDVLEIRVRVGLWGRWRKRRGMTCGVSLGVARVGFGRGGGEMWNRSDDFEEKRMCVLESGNRNRMHVRTQDKRKKYE